MNIRPLYDNVVIRKDEEEETLIILTGDAKQEPNQGTVIAVGDGKLHQDGSQEPVRVSVGDRVVFGQSAGYSVKVDGEDLWVMKDSDIFGTL